MFLKEFRALGMNHLFGKPFQPIGTYLIVGLTMATIMGKGACNSNGDGDSNIDGDGNCDDNGDGDGDGDGDGKSNGNGNFMAMVMVIGKGNCGQQQWQ